MGELGEIEPLIHHGALSARIARESHNKCELEFDDRADAALYLVEKQARFGLTTAGRRHHLDQAASGRVLIELEL
jgi:hypothetical protein